MHGPGKRAARHDLRILRTCGVDQILPNVGDVTEYRYIFQPFPAFHFTNQRDRVPAARIQIHDDQDGCEVLEFFERNFRIAWYYDSCAGLLGSCANTCGEEKISGNGDDRTVHVQ